MRMLYTALLIIGYLVFEFSLMWIYYALMFMQWALMGISEALISIGTGLVKWAESHMENES